MIAWQRATILFALSSCVPLFAQENVEDQRLLAKTRVLYDAPFQRGLSSFACSVEFDWSKHFHDLLGDVTPDAAAVAQRLQSISHRIFVDRSGATVSAIPKEPDLTGMPKAAQLEAIFNSMVPQGLNAWIPASTDVLLPRGNTGYSFEKLNSGYKLHMKGPGLQTELILSADLRVTTGVVQLPQAMRFSTSFQTAPNGYVLASLSTENTTDTAQSLQATFAYTYQAIQGVQIPQQITITPNVSDKWTYVLSDCKVMKGTVIELPAPQGTSKDKTK